MNNLRKKIAKAEKKAKKEVYSEAVKKKKRAKRVTSTEVETKHPTSAWIADLWGNQGDVFFDGYNYWGTAIIDSKIDGNIKPAIPKRWTPKEWEERKTREVIKPVSPPVAKETKTKVTTKKIKPRETKNSDSKKKIKKRGKKRGRQSNGRNKDK